PSGQPVLEADGVGGSKEPELLSWIAGEGGDYLLTVAPHDPGAPSGLYGVELEELRPSTAVDAQRVLAERADSEGEHWWALQDEEPKRKAIARFEEAAALWQAVGDLPRRVRSLNQIGALHRSLGDTARALDLCGEALALAVEIGDRAGEAEARNNLGVARHQAGQIQQAIGDLQQAVRIWESLERPEEVATSSYGLGVVQFAQGETGAALTSLNRALELRQAANDPKQSIVLTAIASIHRDRGEGDMALELFRRALDISRSAGNRNDEANALQNMASIYLRRGELQQALELFNAALELHRSLGNRNQEGQVLSYLGATALYLGDNDRAFDFYSQALQLSRELGSKYWEAVTLRDLGWTLDRRGEPKVALEYHAQAYEIGRQLEDRRIQGSALQGMGRAQISLGSPNEAIRQLEQAVALQRETGNALFEIQAILDLGRAYEALSDEPRAADLFLQALDLSRQRKTLMAEALAQSAVARLERDRGHLPEAAAAIEEALNIIETIRPKVASQRLRVSFFASQREIYDFYIDLLMRRYEADGQSGHLAAALAVSERARARGLLDLLAEGRIDVQRGIDPDLKRREEEVANRISLLQSQLLDDLSRGSQHGARIEAELAAAEEEGERIEWQVRREHPHYAAFRHPPLLSPERIQGLLDDRTAFLEYAVGKEASYLFVVTRDRLAGYRLPPAQEIAEEVDAIREALQKPGRVHFGRYVEAAHQLHEALIAPARELLRDKPRLLISPDGPLLLLSFEALLTTPAPA
ncbi:MAG TPA: tetratricopeptide repeat protein, partial [Thermoanaerobaculia bacterium]